MALVASPAPPPLPGLQSLRDAQSWRQGFKFLVVCAACRPCWLPAVASVLRSRPAPQQGTPLHPPLLRLATHQAHTSSRRWGGCTGACHWGATPRWCHWASRRDCTPFRAQAALALATLEQAPLEQAALALATLEQAAREQAAAQAAPWAPSTNRRRIPTLW